MNVTTLKVPPKIPEIQLSYKSTLKPSLRPKISRSQDAYDILINTWDLSKLEFVEQFKVLILDRANSVSGIFEVSSGSSSGTIADPKLIFAAAIKGNASAIILSHNHPSGNLKPSQADIELTAKIKCAGIFLEIKLHDHLIVTVEGYYSFADEGLL